jgi:hypothetical protein
MQKIFLKIVIVSGLIFSLGLIAACGETPPEEPEGDVVVDDDYYEFQDFSLDEFEIPAVISLPDETANIGASTKPQVIHTESDIKWEINVGPNFQLMIEDYADFTDLIEVKKKELAEQDFFKIEYLIDDKELLLYERTLVVDGSKDAATTVGVEHKSYHVYGQKVIEGITYELQSRADGYEKVIIELMAKSIKSFKPSKSS